jgi:DNA-binding GntR family transcriptional regulator
VIKIDTTAKSTLEDEIFYEIKKAIFSRKIAPNTLLTEDQLAEAFNVSRTPIRHVLKRLHYNKIVDIKPKKGATIYEPSFEEIEETFYVKKILGVEAVRYACDYASPKLTNDLDSLTYKSEEFFKKCDYYNGLMASNYFHFKIIEVTNNKLLYKLYEEITDLTNLYLAFYDSSFENPVGPAEQRKIVEFIRHSDKENASLQFLTHLDRVKKHILYQKNREREINLKDIFKPIK